MRAVMHGSVQLQVPLQASDAAALAGLVSQQAQGRQLDNDLRGRLSARIQALRLSSMAPLVGSLQRDPIHPDAYYVVADTRVGQPESWLLRLALSSSPSSGLFPNSVLIGRMRTNVGHEVVVNAVRFGSGDRANIRTFAERIDPAFLPKLRGAAASISIEYDDLEASLPAAFEWYSNTLRSTGINLAAVPVRTQADVDIVLWSAIRAGWREGYTLEAPTDADLVFTRELSTPEAMAECLQSLKAGGTLPRFVAPHLDALERFAEIAAIARQHGAIVSVRSDGLLPALTLRQIGRATGGKVAYRIGGPCEPGEPASILSAALEGLRG